jgi:hypothetical protein
MRITLDTNAVDKPDLIQKATQMGLDLVVVTVTEMELQNSGIGIDGSIGRTPEIFVLDESRLDVGALASDEDCERFEDVLSAISNGSFPSIGQRENVSGGQRRQLRDAMVFASHVRDTRDIFVTDDARGFINDGRRAHLQRKYQTTIMTAKEFLDYLFGYDRQGA